MNDKLKSKDFDYLFDAILQLRDMQECYDFFEDLCTMQELKSISQRLHVAKLLSDSYVYNDIVKETGASTATISRVNRTLHYGNDGYRAVFERLADKKDEK